MICRNCGMQLNENDRFCISCGIAVDSGDRYDASGFCEKCGAQMGPGGNVCFNCGHIIEGVSDRRVKKKKSKIIIFALLFVIVAVGIGIGVLSVADSDEDVSVTESVTENGNGSETQTSDETTKKAENKTEGVTEESTTAITNKMVEAPTMTTTSTTTAATVSTATTTKAAVTAFYPVSREKMHSDDYIMPSDTRYITNEELDKFGYYEMDYVTNEIYARHGYIFKTEKFAEYFESKSWYKGTVSDMSEVERNLSTIERTNLDTIVAYERAKGWRETPTSATTTRKITTTVKPDKQTTKADVSAVNVVISEMGYTADGRVFLLISTEGWDGIFKSNSQRVRVYAEGVELSGGAMLQVSSAEASDAGQYVYLNLDEHDVDIKNVTIDFEVPEGFLENKAGTKYNNKCAVVV